MEIVFFLYFNFFYFLKKSVKSFDGKIKSTHFLILTITRRAKDIVHFYFSFSPNPGREDSINERRFLAMPLFHIKEIFSEWWKIILLKLNVMRKSVEFIGSASFQIHDFLTDEIWIKTLWAVTFAGILVWVTERMNEWQ